MINLKQMATAKGVPAFEEGSSLATYRSLLLFDDYEKLSKEFHHHAPSNWISRFCKGLSDFGKNQLNPTPTATESCTLDEYVHRRVYNSGML